MADSSPSPRSVDLVSYYVKKCNSSSPTAVGDLRPPIDETTVSPDRVADIAKDFLSKVLGRAINHFEYREDGLHCGAADLQFALESVAREHLRRHDADAVVAMEEEAAEDDGNDDDDDEYVPEEIAAEEPEEEEGTEETLDAEDGDTNEDDDDEDYQPDGEIDAAADDEEEDVDAMDSEEQDTEENEECDLEEGAGNGDSENSLFAALFPATTATNEQDGLEMAQFEAQWREVCSERNISIDMGQTSDCHQVLKSALNAYLAKVLPLIGATASSSLNEAMENNDASSSDVWRIAKPFIRGVMQVALIHMEHCHRMTCNVSDYRFALDFIAREQMHSQVLSLLEREEENSAFDTPLYDSLFPSISEDDMKDADEEGTSGGGFSFLQIQDLWAEALRERGVTNTSTPLQLIDASLYRPLRKALDSYVVAGLFPGDLEPRQLDQDLYKHA